MPIYEYQCQACGTRLEKLQKPGDAPLRDCPDCREPRLQKLISAAGFRLKGSGWYETDFKQDGRRNLAGDREPAKEAATDQAGSREKTGGEKTGGRNGKPDKPAESHAARPSDKAPASKAPGKQPAA